jgi:hypothetical protein
LEYLYKKIREFPNTTKKIKKWCKKRKQKKGKSKKKNEVREKEKKSENLLYDSSLVQASGTKQMCKSCNFH